MPHESDTFLASCHTRVMVGVNVPRVATTWQATAEQQLEVLQDGWEKTYNFTRQPPHTVNCLGLKRLQ